MFSNTRDNDIIALLKSGKSSEQEKFNAIKSIGEQKIKGAVDPLIMALKNDETETVRAWSAWALGEIGDKRAVLPLIAFFETADFSQGMCSSAEALGKLQDNRAVSPLLNELEYYVNSEKGGMNIPLFIVQALGDLGDKRAIPFLKRLLDSHSGSYPVVNKATIIALRKLGYSF
jgi:HEAT repeat protein